MAEKVITSSFTSDTDNVGGICPLGHEILPGDRFCPDCGLPLYIAHSNSGNLQMDPQEEGGTLLMYPGDESDNLCARDVRPLRKIREAPLFSDIREETYESGAFAASGDTADAFDCHNVGSDHRRSRGRRTSRGSASLFRLVDASGFPVPVVCPHGSGPSLPACMGVSLSSGPLSRYAHSAYHGEGACGGLVNTFVPVTHSTSSAPFRSDTASLLPSLVRAPLSCLFALFAFAAAAESRVAARKNHSGSSRRRDVLLYSVNIFLTFICGCFVLLIPLFASVAAAAFTGGASGKYYVGATEPSAVAGWLIYGVLIALPFVIGSIIVPALHGEVVASFIGSALTLHAGVTPEGLGLLRDVHLPAVRVVLFTCLPRAIVCAFVAVSAAIGGLVSYPVIGAVTAVTMLLGLALAWMSDVMWSQRSRNLARVMTRSSTVLLGTDWHAVRRAARRAGARAAALSASVSADSPTSVDASDAFTVPSKQLMVLHAMLRKMSGVVPATLSALVSSSAVSLFALSMALVAFAAISADAAYDVGTIVLAAAFHGIALAASAWFWFLLGDIGAGWISILTISDFVRESCNRELRLRGGVWPDSDRATDIGASETLVVMPSKGAWKDLLPIISSLLFILGLLACGVIMAILGVSCDSLDVTCTLSAELGGAYNATAGQTLNWRSGCAAYTSDAETQILSFCATYVMQNRPGGLPAVPLPLTAAWKTSRGILASISGVVFQSAVRLS